MIIWYDLICICMMLMFWSERSLIWYDMKWYDIWNDSIDICFDSTWYGNQNRNFCSTPFRQTNLEVCLKLIGERGYACQSYLLDASWYGLPQSRRRVYIVCLAAQRSEVSVNASEFFASVKTLLQAMRFESPAADFCRKQSNCLLTRLGSR